MIQSGYAVEQAPIGLVLSRRRQMVDCNRQLLAMFGATREGLVGRSFRVEGLFARFMYKSLYKMHEYALHGGRKVVFSFLARGLSKRSDPQVKLH